MLDKILARLLVSRLKWHDLRSLEPVSRKFGFDRGTPIDRYYIEQFLEKNRSYIKGRTLEVADSNYTRKFGRDVTRFEILHVKQTAGATIIGDLTSPTSLPSNEIDCFVCTQVLNFIFDFQKAIEGIYHLLKPGGVALITVSGISQISRYDADNWGHFWSFYPQGILQSFQIVFGEGNVEQECYGNSLSAISFLKGLAAEELTKEELVHVDKDYPISICIVARKLQRT